MAGRARGQRRPEQPAQGSEQPRRGGNLVPAPTPTQSAWGQQPPPAAAAAPAQPSAGRGRGVQQTPAAPQRPTATPRGAGAALPSGRPAGHSAGGYGDGNGDRGARGNGACGGNGDRGARGGNGDSGARGGNGDRGARGGNGDSGARGGNGDSGARGSNGDRGARGGNGAGNGDRGSIRGKCPITNIIRTRPQNLSTKRGTSGQAISLQTNYFRLLKKPSWQIYQYRVDFSPIISIDGLRRRLIHEQKPTIGGYLFDGTVLFLTVKLNEDVTEFMSKDRDGNPIQTTVKFVGLVSMSTAASVQILNLILRRSMDSLKLQLVGRNFFDALAKIDLPQHQMQLWPGYITSIRQHESDVLLCVEITTKVMRTETIYDILNNCVKNDRDWKTSFQNAVIGMTVLTGYNNKTYRIHDVDFKQSPSSTFETRDGPISFTQYYKKRYGLQIRDQDQALLVIKSSARDLRGGQTEVISLVPELCRATGMSERMLNDFRLKQAVDTYTKLSPRPRVDKLHQFNKRLQSTPESVANLKEWNFDLDKNLVEVPGRVLPRESILFQRKTVPTNAEVDWSREFRNIQMFTSVSMKRWIIIVPNRNEREAKDFVSILKQAANGMRYEVAEPRWQVIQDDRSHTYAEALEQAACQDPQLIMCIVSNNNADRYSIIKKKCCVERSIPSQVMVSRTITPKQGKPISSLLTVGTKVAIQINSKLGGAPWMVDIPMSGCMVIGFDVCHDTKDKSKSFGALVATMDMKTSQKYFSAVSAHTSGQELSNEFALNVTKALTNYMGEHKSLPSRILVYRDGVGEGQTNYVIEHEVANLHEALKKVYGGAEYKMAFIVVSKRINTRFFNNDLNPPPGTVIDDIVTLPERYDFFLVSQSAKQGTVSPTNYNVLYDNLGLSPDQIQRLTYKMTHLYFNWTGTLRVPAVCQYAHKLAFLVGNSIHQSPSNLLEKQLYFL